MASEDDESLQLSVRWRLGIERRLHQYGSWVAGRPRLTLVMVTLVQLGLVALWAGTSDPMLPLETDVSELWVETGGRLEEELDYVERTRAPGWERGVNTVIFTAKEGKELLSQEMLRDHLTVAAAVLAIEVNFTAPDGQVLVLTLDGLRADGTNSELSLCDYVPFPDELFVPRGSALPEYLETLRSTQTPCNRVTVLDCFQEGDFDFYVGPVVPTLQNFNNELIEESYGLYGYRNRKPGQPQLPSVEDMATPEDVLEAIKRGCKGYVTNLMDWDVSILWGGYELDADGHLASAQALQYVIPMAYPQMLTAKLAHRGVTSADVEALQEAWSIKFEQTVLAFNADPDALAASQVAVLSEGAFDRMFKEFSNANSTLIGAGYLLMALFVVLSQYSRKAASNTVLVGLLGLIAVFLGNLSALGLLVMSGMKMNATVMQVLPFLALGLGVDDLFVLMSVYREGVRQFPGDTPRELVAYVMRTGGVSVTLTSTCNAAAFAIGGVIPLPAVQVFCLASALAVVVNYLTLMLCVPSLLTLKAAAVKRSKVGVSGADSDDPGVGAAAGDGAKRAAPRKSVSSEPVENAYEGAGSSGFLHGSYLPLLRRTPVRVCGVAAFVAVTGVLGGLISQVENGLEMKDVVQQDTPLHTTVQLYADFFHLQPAQVVTTKLDYGDPAVQAALVQLMVDMEAELPSVLNSEAGWVLKMQEHYRGAGVAEEDAGPIDAKGGAFTPYVRNFTDPLAASYLPAYQNEMTGFGFDVDDGRLNYATMKFDMVTGGDTADTVKVLEDIRAFLASRCGEGKVLKRCFPAGLTFTFWEQYVSLEKNFFRAVLLCEVAIFVSCLAMLTDVTIAFFVSIFSGAVVLQIYGSLFFVGIKFSAIPAVSLIMSIGLAVEFTAHIATHFEGAIGSRIDRMCEALHHMFVPIAEGGFSSFLGFACLAGSPFAFIRLYYFGIYLLVVLCGLVNGLFFLPVVLSFCGPVPDERSAQLLAIRRRSIHVPARKN